MLLVVLFCLFRPPLSLRASEAEDFPSRARQKLAYLGWPVFIINIIMSMIISSSSSGSGSGSGSGSSSKW